MKKSIKSIILVLLTLIILTAAFPTSVLANDSSFQPRLSAPSRSNSYYNRSLNIFAKTGYGMPNCTAYAYGRIYVMPAAGGVPIQETDTMNTGRSLKSVQLPAGVTTLLLLKPLTETPLLHHNHTGAEITLIPAPSQAERPVSVRNFMAIFTHRIQYWRLKKSLYMFTNLKNLYLI